MPINRLSRAFALFFAVLLTSTAFAGASRAPAPPSNDYFAGALQIVIGKDYKIGNIGAAGNEVSEPAPSCFYGGPLKNSVWFKFTTPAAYTPSVYLSSAGSRLYSPLNDGVDTVMALYSGTSIGALTQEACNDESQGTGFGEISFSLDSSTTYYVVVGTYEDQAFEAASFVKLNTRLTGDIMYPLNYNFEDELGASDWKVKRGSGDVRTCDNPTYPAYAGDCTFGFTSNPGQNSSLLQTVTFPTGFVPRKNAVVTMNGYFRVMDTSAVGTATITLTVTYSDGTPPTVRARKLKGTGTMANYQQFGNAVTFASGKVSGMKIQVDFKSTTGTLLVDNFWLRYHAPNMTRDSGLLPVPPPPAG